VAEVCADCGFDWGSVTVAELPGRLGDLAGRYRLTLTSTAETELRRRPAPEVWSALEYACHTRDVLLAQRERIYLALVEERPSFARMNREERVVLARYAEESPVEVAVELDLAFRLVTTALTGRSEDDWRRLLMYNYPGPQEHDLAWLARHTVHECEHHYVDIRRGLGS
jgi:hypothetical protein